VARLHVSSSIVFLPFLFSLKFSALGNLSFVCSLADVLVGVVKNVFYTTCLTLEMVADDLEGLFAC